MRQHESIMELGHESIMELGHGHSRKRKTLKVDFLHALLRSLCASIIRLLNADLSVSLATSRS
jgi:hypothetical protein